MAGIVHRLLTTLPPSAMMTKGLSPMDNTSALRFLATVHHRPLTTFAPSAMLTKALSPMATTHTLCLIAKISHLLSTNLTPNGMLTLASDSGLMLTLIPSLRTALCPMMAMAAAPGLMTTVAQTAIPN